MLKQTKSSRLQLIFLLAANTVPLLGVKFFGWSVEAILVVYWLESLIIGALNIPRIFATRGGVGQKTFMSLFFCIHFGAFCGAHATILVSVFKAGPLFSELLQGGAMLWSALGFGLSHFVSFIVRLARKEFAEKTPNQQLMAPYSRVMIMHIVVLFGSIGIGYFGASVFAIVLLVVLKTGFDVTAHLRETERAKA